MQIPAAPAISRCLGALRARGLKATDALPAIALALCGTALVFFHARRYLPFISDDALISLRYASRFLDGQGLTWTDGRPVEGYSNLLWILLISVFGLFGMDLVDSVRWLGLFCAAALCAALATFFSPKRTGAFAPALVALASIGLSAPIAVWTIGGLEQPLVAALLGVVLANVFAALDAPKHESRFQWASIGLGLLCLSRPDSPMFAVLVFTVVFLSRRSKRLPPSEIWLLLVPAFVVVSQTAFRLVYYGEWLPNTAYVKLSPSLEHVRSGMTYVRGGLRALEPFSALALAAMLALLFSREQRVKSLLLVSCTTAWIAYVVLLGGDTQPAWRHFAPLIVFFAFALGMGVDFIGKSIVSRLPKSPRILIDIGHVVLAIPLVLMLLKAQAMDARRDGQGHIQGAITERWEWRCRKMALVLKRAFLEKRPLMAVTTAGCLPYWSELPALDMLGLTDHYIAHNRPKNFGRGWIGHELGDGRYVASRKPDLVSFGLSLETARWRSGVEMQRDPSFYDEYKMMRFAVDDPNNSTERVWIRQRSERIGIKRTNRQIDIPGYLFMDNRQTRAHLDRAGHLVVSVSAKAHAAIVLKPRLDGEWSAKPYPPRSAGAITAEIRDDSSQATLVILKTASRRPVEVERVVLSRRDIR